MRVGIGYDVHAFAEDREFWLGGIKIPYEKGLLGHSDADVLLHSICDALLGAAALGDIGKLFPDSDPQYKGIDSKILLSHTCKLLKEKGFSVNNIDCVVALQKPKIGNYIPQMRETIAKILETVVNNVSIKATTTEKLGFVGREEGVAAYVIVSVC